MKPLSWRLFPLPLLCKLKSTQFLWSLEEENLNWKMGLWSVILMLWFYHAICYLLWCLVSKHFCCYCSIKQFPSDGRLGRLLWVPASKWFAAVLWWLILSTMSSGLMAEQNRLWRLLTICNFGVSEESSPDLQTCFIHRQTKLKRKS